MLRIPAGTARRQSHPTNLPHRPPDPATTPVTPPRSWLQQTQRATLDRIMEGPLITLTELRAANVLPAPQEPLF